MDEESTGGSMRFDTGNLSLLTRGEFYGDTESILYGSCGDDTAFEGSSECHDAISDRRVW